MSGPIKADLRRVVGVRLPGVWTAELHDEGRIVNHKKVMRLMKENGLTVRPRRRFIATTDTDHDGADLPEPCQGHCARRT